MLKITGTTIIAVRGNNGGAMGGDGQVTLSERTIIKRGAKKVRRIYQGKVLAGFAGSAADALTLLEKFEGRLEEYRGNLPRAAVALARDWRTDRVLRRLEAQMLVQDSQHLLIVSGNGEVVEPDDNAAAIGSGGAYALAAAKALLKHTSLSPRQIVEESLRIAASICVFTNENLTIEEI